MRDAISLLCAALADPNATLSPLGWRSIAPTERQVLLDAGLAKPGVAADRIACPVCSPPHFESVVRRTGGDGAVRLSIRCPVNHRVDVTEEDRRTYSIDVLAVAKAISKSLALTGVLAAISHGRVWHCGGRDQHGVRLEVYFAWGLVPPERTAILKAVPRSSVPPLLLVPAPLPTEHVWPQPSPTVYPLNAIATFVENKLVIDPGCVRHAQQNASNAAQAPYMFRRTGDAWEVAFDGQVSRGIKDRVGMHYIAQLLAQPYRDIGAAALLEARTGVLPGEVSGTSGKEMDSKMQSDLKAAKAKQVKLHQAAVDRGDTAVAQRAQQLGRNIDAELQKRKGLRNRSREKYDAGRASNAVSMAIAREFKALRKKIEPLGAHLEAFVHTGLACRYAPDKEIDWLL